MSQDSQRDSRRITPTNAQCGGAAPQGYREAREEEFVVLQWDSGCKCVCATDGLGAVRRDFEDNWVVGQLG